MNKIVCIILSLLAGGQAIAQTDSVFVTTARQNALAQYNRQFDRQSRLYNGSEYQTPPQTNDTHPFLETDNWQKANIEYDGLTFYDIDILCDILNDKLVIEYFNGSKVELISEKLKSFSIDDNKFVNIQNAEQFKSLPEKGFHQVLYDGEIQCLAKKKKTYQRNVEAGVIQMYYRPRVTYFIRKDGQYHPVKSKGSVLKLLSDQKNELRKYIKKEKILFSQDRENALVKILTHYDGLKR